MAKKQKSDVLLEAPVEFGTVSIGKGSASIPCKFDRDWFPLARAEELLCGRRLTACIATGDQQDDQPLMFDDMHAKIDGIFESKGFTVKPDHLKATLNIQLAEIDVELLSHFASRKGRVKILGAELIEDREESQEAA